MRSVVLAGLLAASVGAWGGCGSNKPLFVPGDKVPATGSGSGAGSGSAVAAAKRDEKATMPPAVAKLHDALAKKSCGVIADIDADTAEIAKATPPTTANADTWTEATNGLVDSVRALDGACQSNDKAQIDAAFGRVNGSYDALIAAAGPAQQP